MEDMKEELSENLRSEQGMLREWEKIVYLVSEEEDSVRGGRNASREVRKELEKTSRRRDGGEKV